MGKIRILDKHPGSATLVTLYGAVPGNAVLERVAYTDPGPHLFWNLDSNPDPH
jgi:hypothetical protein